MAGMVYGNFLCLHGMSAQKLPETGSVVMPGHS